VACRNAAKLVARGDVELLEHLVQVVLHRAGADEELCADLGIGQAILGELGDLRLLGVSPARASSVCLRAVSPVAMSSRPARSAKPSAPMPLNIS
jgi:hypothetical protein